MSIAIGDRLGPYEIRGPLGAGGMGVVYSAFDTRLQRSVAIKVLPDSGSPTRQPSQRPSLHRNDAADGNPYACSATVATTVMSPRIDEILHDVDRDPLGLYNADDPQKVIRIRTIGAG